MKFILNPYVLLIVFLLAVHPTKAQVVINEIYINAVANDGSPNPNTGEWIELYNTTASTADVSCWVFCDGDFCVTLPEGTTIAAGDFFLIGSTAGVSCVSCDFPGLSIDLDWATCGCTSGSAIGTFTNGGEQVVLFDDMGTEVNSVYWSGGQNLPTDQFSASLGSCGSQSLSLLAITDPGALYENIINAGGQGESKVRTTNGGSTWASEPTPSPGASNTPLPVTLLFFDATVSQNHVKLSWSTASEVNNHYFTIERSQNAIDFSPILSVDGAGNSAERLSYSALDPDPLPGRSYYRLKQTDFDGTTETFRMVPVVANTSTANDLVLYPQPASLDSPVNVRFSSPAETEVELVITSVNGQVINEWVTPTQEGLNEIQVPRVDLPGIYVITLSSPQFFYRRQLVIY